MYYEEDVLAVCLAVVAGAYLMLAYLDWADFMEEWNVI